MTKKLLFILFIISLFTYSVLSQDKEEDKSPYKSSTFNGLKFRSIGPAVTSGRITDFAVNPNNIHEYYVAVACGNVWKTTTSGTTGSQYLTLYGSHSIGCVTIDPKNTHVVYVGTGENNSQRSVSWGDGLYRSEDGGKSFSNIGLKKSEHIAKILIDPRDSKVIYAAAQGPLWGPGGDRGLYKSIDYGATWGFCSLHQPKHRCYRCCYGSKRPGCNFMRHHTREEGTFWTLLNGGPEGGIHKSTDAGKTWNKLTNGLPTGDIGRIGLAISPVNPDYIYAIIEAAEDKSGFFRTTNRGVTWEKIERI
ncbi:MAG: hypothetical protein U5J96_11620 [Ignavibacteriaceae bacterium]|nr:hypothetical protein [Ignavibacteriaceae bacterium]